ncbi:Nucleotidyltransferase OS=Oscillatoria nigro-viridis PCC 7112 GN=Osc7112_4161 PE=4 SV=1: Nuc-transf [Gemmataceae bacterium]|nr:Nucleotidyltransferase OS=Oscillatoria nigro-viridis PCC 7112 GN=Osc7112_4161 PE=4 SV=1: Nuc-transf [Gemmataceae bacterium]VTU01187.1 Nucleotidyltransferase OS=Oscillatoria nigro-viridis PCC 7112 GN=Osc7112_4161 PE=4 SV=1: Nuc-transf [Gemmataceae bacterium]
MPDRDDNLPPNFLIPVGTQVVLRYARRVPGTAAEKPVGTVGEIVDAPESNDRAYLVRFLDGSELRLKFGELLVRRVDHSVEGTATAGPDVSAFVVYRVTVGSRAFGLSTESSDEDRRGVYLPPADWHWSLTKPPEQVESFAPGVEEVDWEIEKFVRLALHANPNILETLWSPAVLFCDETGDELRSIRTCFLSRHLYRTYSGYVLSQFRLMRRGYDATGRFKAKHAMHLIRLLHSGIHAMAGGEVRVDVQEHRDELLAIRHGKVSFEEVSKRALDLDRQFQEAFTRTALPEKPDTERANRFLIAARRRAARR